jgi:hypothetical protein
MRGATFVLALMTAVSVSEIHVGSQGPDRQIREERSMKGQPLVGDWTANIAKSKLSPDSAFKSVTLRVDLSGDSMTMSSHLMFVSGQEQRATETFRTDGTETPGTLTSGVTLVAKWLDPYVLASLAKKDGKVIAVVTYEVSADGNTLTSRSSGMVEQTIVFDRTR